MTYLMPSLLVVNVLNAYDYFYEWIRIYIGKTCDYDKLDSLLSTIKTRFDFVQIKLDSLEPSEKIFESINSTGRNACGSSIISGIIFSYAQGKLEYNPDLGGTLIVIIFIGSTGPLKTVSVIGMRANWIRFLRRFSWQNWDRAVLNWIIKIIKIEKLFEMSIRNQYYKDIKRKNEFSKHKTIEEHEFIEFAIVMQKSISSLIPIQN